MDSILAGLSATKDAVALLFGLVILVVTPQVLSTFRDLVAAFREEMKTERAAHREESSAVTAAVHNLAIETRAQTSELEAQSEELRRQTAKLESMSARPT